MSKSKNELCRIAASSLKLKDISLAGCRFEIGDFQGGEGVREEKQGVRYNLDKSQVDGAEIDELNIIVHLGLRVVSPDTESGADDAPFAFLIEAEFLVEYLIENHIDEEAIKAFAEFNAVHNAWPFWRQHVFDIVQRARLPHLDIPLFTG